MNLVLGNVAKPPGPDCFQAMSKDADKDEQKGVSLGTHSTQHKCH